MKKILLLALIIMFTGCAKIDYSETEQTTTDTGSDTAGSEKYEDVESPLSVNETKAQDFKITKTSFTAKKQFEDIDPDRAYKSLYDFEGTGYVQLDSGESISFEVDVPSNQHYRLVICICTTAFIASVSVNGTDVGSFNMAEAFSFTSYSLDSVYMESGVNVVEIKALRGIGYLDYYTLYDANPPQTSQYEVSKLPANKNANNNVIDLLNYFGSAYGKRIITAQHCTQNSNAELNAIYSVTGRYPAIRAGDLGKYSRNYSGGDKDANRELELAEEWAENGGIVSFSWTWYEPVTTNEISRYYSSQTVFKLNAAFTAIDIAVLDTDQIEAYYNSGTISKECYNIILDIDDMAENLKLLQEKGISVLWRPLYEAGTGWYWWGDCLPDSYIWLWRLMFNRMSNYHELNNLIWVWNGESHEFYPGDDYVDIIGEDIYNGSDTSNLPRFNSTLRYTTRRRFVAMTECGLVPDPDILRRDSAMWLWFGLFKGDYIVADDGLYKSDINTEERLNHAYNHELTITLDELPDFD